MKLAIFNAQQEYLTDLESFCDRNCISQVLSYYGVSNPLLYLDASLNLHFMKDEEKIAGYDVVFRSNWMLGSYQDKVQIYNPTDKSNWEVWEDNKVRLREGIPIITGVDIFHLDYSSNYKRYHSNHKCILCGYTEDDKYATIIDWYEWKFKGNVTLDQYLKARASICPKDESPYSGYPIENEWVVIDDFGWNIDCRTALKQTIDVSLRDYYHGESNGINGHYYGISAIKKIYEVFLENEELDPVEQAKLIANVRVVFLFLYTRIKLFRAYILEASKTVHIGLLEKLLESLEEDIEQWRKTIIVMLKGTVSVNERSYKKIASKMLKLIELEERRYQILCDLSLML